MCGGESCDFQCCFGHSVCHCWGRSLVFGAALSTDKRETASNCQFELWMADFFPAYFTQCIDSSVKLCFHRALFPFRAHFSVSIQKSWEVHRVICIPLNGCPWTNTTRSVKLNTDGKFNNVCFYCRKLYQCAEELGYPPTITHFLWRSSFIQRN